MLQFVQVQEAGRSESVRERGLSVVLGKIQQDLRVGASGYVPESIEKSKLLDKFLPATNASLTISQLDWLSILGIWSIPSFCKRYFSIWAFDYVNL
jgi:hypothetical protein